MPPEPAPHSTRLMEVIASMDIGGSQHQAVTLMNSVDRSRITPKLVYFAPGPQLEKLRPDVESLALGGAVGISVAGIFRILKHCARLYREIRSWRPDVVHSAMPASNLVAQVAAWLARVPRRYAHVRGSARQFSYSTVPVSGRHSRLRQRLMFARFMAIDVVTSWFATRMIAVSHETADILRRYIPGRKVLVIHNGVDVEYFQPRRAPELRDRLGLPPDGPIVTNIGNISFYKGQEYLVEAAPAIVREFPTVAIVVVGKGNNAYERVLRRRCADLGVAKQVIFAGTLAGSRDILSVTDVKVLCSKYEGLPNVLLEAMACGVPIVATRVGGNPELVAHGVNGLLVAPDDPAGLADAVIALLRDPVRRTAMGLAGRRRAETEFSLHTMIATLESLFDGALDHHRQS